MKNKIFSSTALAIFLAIVFFLLLDTLNSYGDKLRFRKYKLQKEINLLHTRYIDTYTRLANFQIIGQLEEKAKQHNLNLTRGEKPPYIIYIEKSKKQH